VGAEGLLNLEGKDLAVFMLACALGWLASSFIPEGAWAVYTSVLVAYHLFLAWLVITAEGETGVSLPVASTIVTHLACLAIIFPLGMARHFVPFFGVVRYGIAALAIFERGWLFSGRISKQPKMQNAPDTSPKVTGTPREYEEWLKYLAQRKQVARAPGVSLKAEYEQWLLARRSAEQAAPSSES
jgi:hypothetical protein